MSFYSFYREVNSGLEGIIGICTVTAIMRIHWVNSCYTEDNNGLRNSVIVIIDVSTATVSLFSTPVNMKNTMGCRMLLFLEDIIVVGNAIVTDIIVTAFITDSTVIKG